MIDCGELNERIRGIVARRMRSFRLAEGITISEAAGRVRMHRPVMGRVERGVHTLELETCALVASATGHTLNDVLWDLDRQLGLKHARRKRASARAARA